MKFSRLISTIFLISTFLCILLFAGIFWFYSSADSKTLSLLKDSLSTASGFFGGITTLIAAYIASRLFNDWKEQHNKEIEIQFILKVIESQEFFDLKITKMFQFDYTTIDFALRHDSFIRECLILELDVRVIQSRYSDYYNFLGKEMPEAHKNIFLTLRKSINQLKDTDSVITKREIIKKRIYFDLVDFTDQYVETIHSSLLKNLKALN